VREPETEPDVPDSMLIWPLDELDAASADLMLREPEYWLADEVVPVTIEIEPPEEDCEDPAASEMLPPTAAPPLLVPADKDTLPPFPLDAIPALIDTSPPATVELPTFSSMLPLEPDVAAPDLMLTLPPTDPEAWALPAVREIAPPFEFVLAPALIITAPPTCCALVPAFRFILPVLLVAASPDDSVILPETPDCPAPDSTVNDPL
jgi:hypothetical protein